MLTSFINFMSVCSFSDIAMTKKKFTRNKQQKIDLIYKTFFDLILKQGYHNVSTNVVAEMAEISIGTIYRYFPEGKKDIIRKYFQTTIEKMFEKESLINLNDNNIKDILQHFIEELVKNHKKNKGFNIAFRSVIQADKELHDQHKEAIYDFFKDRAKKLRIVNKNFREMPENKLIKVFIFMYNLTNAILYHHLSVRNLFNTDEELIDFLTNILIFSLQYLYKS